MVRVSTGSKTNQLFAVIITATLACSVIYLMKDNADQRETIQSLQGSIAKLKSELESSELALKNSRASSGHDSNAKIDGVRSDDHKHNESNQLVNSGTESPAIEAVTGSVSTLKDLETDSESDHRSTAEKLTKYLLDNPTKEKIAVASRVVFDKANDREGVPDYVLLSMYSNQSDADLKRVIAQVLSQRGNNALLDNQIAETQALLKSQQATERQQALSQLAKTHSVKAVDAIAPYLQDPDTNVKLEALFALRDTGNQRHVGLVEMMVNDPDPSVSSLASDVISRLKTLSSSARTNYSRSDIEAELPPMANP